MVFPKMPEKIHPSPLRHAYVGENEIDGGFFEKSERHFHRGRHPDPEMVSAKNFRQQVEGHGVVLDHKDRLSGNIAFGNQTDIRTFFSARVHSPHYQKRGRLFKSGTRPPHPNPVQESRIPPPPCRGEKGRSPLPPVRLQDEWPPPYPLRSSCRRQAPAPFRRVWS